MTKPKTGNWNMTSDIALLQVAAKSAGIKAEWYYGCGDALCLLSQNAENLYWNPLLDDGQALMLADAMKLTVYHTDTTVIVIYKQYLWEWVVEGVNEDRGALTRRAIVSVAAIACTINDVAD